MEKRAYDIFSKANRDVSIKIIPGHFATKHSHVSHCIDMTSVKSQLNMAKSAAKVLADSFASTPVDTIISLERMKMVGAFMANYLSSAGVNARQNIAVITPELSGNNIILRDNFLPFVKDKNVLVLTASATTGQTVNDAVSGIGYYGGTVVGAATIFGGEFGCSVPLVKLFGVGDIDGYRSFSTRDCPLCRSGIKVDAVVNSYGYSKII
jgi:orotate phosphoribosyltransferase